MECVPLSGVIYRTVLSYMPLTDVFAALPPSLSSKGDEREIKMEAGPLS